MRRSACVHAAIAVLTILIFCQARHARTWPCDDPTWFSRSRTPPWAVATSTERYWAIDVPAVNRWFYWPFLRLTGYGDIPPEAKPCWNYRGASIYWMGWATPTTCEGWHAPDPTRVRESWEELAGSHAPRKAVVAMRFLDICVFLAGAAGLWVTARMALRSHLLAGVAVLPFFLSPLYAMNVSFRMWSGDIFLMAALSWMLAAWLRAHLSGRALTGRSIALVSVLAGVAVGCKLNGVLALAAYCAWLAFASRGASRAANPIAACAISFAAFAVINPVVLMEGNPLATCADMVARRGQVVADYIAQCGPMSWTLLLHRVLWWWPLLPVLVLALWSRRRERWFWPVAAWGAFLCAGTVAGLAQTRMLFDQYMTPMEMGLYFPFALSVLSLLRSRNDGVPPHATGRPSVRLSQPSVTAPASHDARRPPRMGAPLRPVGG